MEIIVAANGCSDRTVEVAKAAAPGAIVLDLEAGSKTQAINAANAAASHFPRIVLDADVECSYHSLAALAAALEEPGVTTAAPAIRLEMSHASWLLRAYYRAWLKQPFAKAGKGGAGCYGLSREAIEAAGPFPDIIGDDIWIHTRFPDETKRYVERDAQGREVFSLVRPPATALRQVKVEARRMIGNAQVKRDYPSPYFALANRNGGLSGSLRSGASPIELFAFYLVKLMVRIETRLIKWRGRSEVWARDASSRGA